MNQTKKEKRNIKYLFTKVKNVSCWHPQLPDSLIQFSLSLQCLTGCSLLPITGLPTVMDFL